MMDPYPFIVAKATLLFLAAVLIVEYAIRRRNISRDLVHNRQKQQQLAVYHAELKNLKKELARKGEIAEKLPQITKKMTEKLPSDAYPAIAVRSIKDFFHAKIVGYFAPVVGSSDYSLVLITSTTEKQAISFAEKLREKISGTDIAIPGTEVPVRITVSGGLAMFLTHGQSTTELFRAADDALFESKRQGRNRILIATSVGLDGGIAKGTDADRETPKLTDISVDTGSDAVEYPLGELGGDPRT